MQRSLCGAVAVAVAVASTCLLVVVASAQATDPPPQTRTLKIPPLVILEPPKNVAFREHEPMQMLCVASGYPNPEYTWEINGEPFDPTGTDGRISMQPGVGTLLFADPLPRDHGIYQCFAQNDVGKALTVKTDLRTAFLNAFPSRPISRHYPELGSSLTIRCVPPRSFPQPLLFWATKDGETLINLTSRVSMDPEGNLHLANVLKSDYLPYRYICIVHNRLTRNFTKGDEALVFPEGHSVQEHPVSIRWKSPTDQRARRGGDWRVKCIFGGSPTPQVTWERTNGTMPPTASVESFGLELVIRNVQLEDAGTYLCRAVNNVTSTPVHVSFDLQVESAPYWVHKPESVNAEVNGRAEIFCKTSGVPEPTNFWYINGVPLHKVPPDPRRVVTKERFLLVNVTTDDAQVVQCNSTNKHGYNFTNAYIVVLGKTNETCAPTRCYKYLPSETEPVTRADALRICAQHDMTLPIVSSAEELDALNRVTLLNAGHLLGLRFWLGAKSNANIGDWYWVNGGIYRGSANLKSKPDLQCASTAYIKTDDKKGRWAINEGNCNDYLLPKRPLCSKIGGNGLEFTSLADKISTWHKARGSCLTLGEGWDLAHPGPHCLEDVSINSTESHWIGLRTTEWVWVNGEYARHGMWDDEGLLYGNDYCLYVEVGPSLQWKSQSCERLAYRIICSEMDRNTAHHPMAEAKPMDKPGE